MVVESDSSVDFLERVVQSLGSRGVLRIELVQGDRRNLMDKMTLAGFLGVVDDGVIRARSPALDRDVKVSLNQKKVSLSWAAAAEGADGDQEEILDEDELLEAEEFARPDKENKKIQATRKPCANCTCGRKEEFEASQPKKEDHSSSCGKCHLGDAFRCGTCPYLGLPPFEAGEKVTISSNLMVSDL
uniref:Anamorsin C-terminal domain-containing protein n=1 Tax=Rhodosorus marinus TaxID=101924 RepID=A0A7S0BJ35_9RHOD